MAKEYYDVSHKTYLNKRIKRTIFGRGKSYPLYVQVTYDRKTHFFKSYYFDLFARSKYHYLDTIISQIERLETRLIDRIVELNSRRFDLKLLIRQYKILSQDVLDSFDEGFKVWLADYLMREGLQGLAVLLENARGNVCAIRVWDDLRRILDPEAFRKMEEMAAQSGPYIPLAMYVRHASPKGPFCLPLYEWSGEKRAEIGDFIRERFPAVEFGRIVLAVDLLLYPQ